MNDEQREAGLTDRADEEAGVKAVGILANFEPGDRLANRIEGGASKNALVRRRDDGEQPG